MMHINVILHLTRIIMNKYDLISIRVCVRVCVCLFRTVTEIFNINRDSYTFTYIQL